MSRILELFSELQSTGRAISELEKKRALLRVLTHGFDITAESVIYGSFKYHRAELKLIVREIRLLESNEVAERATVAHKRVMKCFKSGGKGT